MSDYGIAIDVGTTNLSFFLVDRKQNCIIDKTSQINPQTKFGADILTRYTATVKDNKVNEEMHNLILWAIKESISRICKDNSVSMEEITKVFIVGNTIMYSFLLNMDPKPFITNKQVNYKFYTRKNLNKIDFGLNNNTHILIPSPIVSYIGSDALALILYTEINKSKDMVLAIDFGTNTEIILGNKDGIMITSVAGGAAFEDSSISISSPAQEGAIYKTTFNNNTFNYSYFGSRASSVCGSGIVDIVAELRKHGFIDNTGRFTKTKTDFTLINNIKINQKDIRSVQLAKAATCAAINLLVKEKRITFGDIKKVFITGNFGNYLNINNSKYIGLLPNIDSNKIKIVKDGAGAGAVMLLSKEYNIKKIFSKIRFVDLPTHPKFQEEFVTNMTL